MSVSSAMSGMSVSIHGEEMPLDQAIEETFKQLQTHLNNTQTNLIQLSMTEDRGEGFKYSYEMQKKVEWSISEMTLLFKDLKSITKQVKLSPTTDEEKQWKLSFDINFQKECEEQK